MRKYSVVLSVAGTIAAIGFAACGNTPDSNGNDVSMQQATSDGGGADGDSGACTPTQLFSCSEGQIASIASAFNQGQIDQSQFAADNATSTQVKSFAMQMVKDQTAAQKTATQVASNLGLQPTDNWISKTIGLESTANLGILRTATQGQNGSPPTLDQTYMSQQILAHVTALGLFDQVLIPGAESPDLKTALTNARKVVAAHAAQALLIEKSLVGDSCGGKIPSDAGADADSGADSGEDGGPAESTSDAGGGGSDSGGSTMDAGTSNPWGP